MSSDESTTASPKNSEGVCELFKCSTCEARFFTKEKLDEHNVSCEKTEKIVCIVCKTSFKKRRQLIDHCKKYHPSQKAYKCKVCEYRTDTFNELKLHENNNHDITCKKCGFSCSSDGFHKHKYSCEKRHLKLCSKCNNVFEDLWALNKHVKEAHSQLRIQDCKTCGYIGKGVNDLKRHEATHTDEKQCKHCSFEFLNVKERQVHESKHLDKDGNVHFNCYYCEAKFEEKEKYAEHFLPHYLTLLPHKCKYCPRRFQNQGVCAQHILKLHEEMIPTIQDDKLTRLERATIAAYGFEESDLHPVLERNNDDQLAFRCKKCEKKIFGCKLLNSHYEKSLTCKLDERIRPRTELDNMFKMNIKSEEPADNDDAQKNMDETEQLTNYCNTCEKSFKTKENYKEHLESHKGTYDCQFCGSRLGWKIVLKKHEEDCVKNKKQYTTCNKCHAEFENLLELSNHLKQEHTDSKSIECKCGYQATSERHLANHIKCHNVSKKFKCEICGKGFSLKATLIQHMNFHEGMNKCNVCHMDFSTAFTLKKHMKIHEKNALNKETFKCLDCDEVFEDKQVFHVHKQTEHPEYQPYECEVCGKRFPTKPMFESHLLIHSDEKSYECEQCGKKCRHESSYKSHLKLHEKFKTDQEQKCFCCELIITDLFTMQRHISNHHPEKIKMNGNKKLYKCPLCNSKEKPWNALLKHYKLHFSEKHQKARKLAFNPNGTPNNSLFEVNNDQIRLNKCKHCPKTYQSITKCATHMVEAHEDKLVPVVDDGLTYLEQVYIQMYEFEREVAPGPERNEKQELALNCRKCGTEFFGWRVLRHHYAHSKVCKLSAGSATTDMMEIDEDNTDDQEDEIMDEEGSLVLETSPLPLAAVAYQFLVENESVCMVIWCNKVEFDLLTLASLNSHRLFICVMDDPRLINRKQNMTDEMGLKVSNPVKLTDSKTTIRIVEQTRSKIGSQFLFRAKN